MSGWFSYFTGARDTKTTTRQAIVGIREQLSMLDKKEEYLEKKIEDELRKAKQNAISNKSGKPEPSPKCCGPLNILTTLLLAWWLIVGIG